MSAPVIVSIVAILVSSASWERSRQQKRAPRDPCMRHQPDGGFFSAPLRRWRPSYNKTRAHTPCPLRKWRGRYPRRRGGSSGMAPVLTAWNLDERLGGPISCGETDG